MKPAKPKRVRRGIALVEYALATPILLMILAVGLDFGRAMRTAGAVAAAARAGAAWGSMSSANAQNVSGIQSAAVNSAPDISGLTVTSSQSCQCANGTGVSCTGSCAGNMLMYVQVNVQAATTNFFSYSGLGFGGTTSAQAKMRVQ
ncbi:MAG TPA: TadE family protein [Verrucomicrobiae bacterium]|nr:TadE family protein [Verrucomicrobiae bacterium]